MQVLGVIMENFKKGDLVTHPFNGRGVVKEFLPNQPAPLYVVFNNGAYSSFYNANGISNIGVRKLYAGHGYFCIDFVRDDEIKNLKRFKKV